MQQIWALSCYAGMDETERRVGYYVICNGKIRAKGPTLDRALRCAAGGLNQESDWSALAPRTVSARLLWCWRHLSSAVRHERFQSCFVFTLCWQLLLLLLNQCESWRIKVLHRLKRLPWPHRSRKRYLRNGIKITKVKQ